MEIHVLTVIFVLAIVCLDLNKASKNGHNFDTVIRVALVFVLVHVVIAFIGNTLGEQYSYIDWAAPFGLIYGPLVYIGYLSSTGEMPEKNRIRLHILPFLLALLCYILYIFLPFEPRYRLEYTYANILYIAITLSWLMYVVWVIYLIRKKSKVIDVQFKNLLSSIVIVLFTLAVFLTIIVYIRIIKEEKPSGITKPMMVYLGMLGGIVLIYRYTFRSTQKSPSVGDASGSLNFQKVAVVISEDTPKLEYQKSSLKEEVMVSYSKRVNAFIESGAYLDIDLSLGKIATELKIPKHHLSQLFSQHYKQGFLEYINTLRIHHACSILNNSEIDANITDIAEQCGFKSKPSFYRNFKNITGMTPTDFRSSLKEPAS